MSLTMNQVLQRARPVLPVLVLEDIDLALDLAAAYLGQRLQVATWIIESDQRFKMTRSFQVVRPADGSTLLRALTTFACIELSSGKPRRMPAEFLEGYGRAVIEGYPREL